MRTKQQQNSELHFTVHTNKQYRYTKRLLVLLKYLFVIQHAVCYPVHLGLVIFTEFSAVEYEQFLFNQLGLLFIT